MTGEPWPDDLDERLARLVHDLRTPLTIAAGFADLLLTGGGLPEDRQREYLERIAAATRDMKGLLDDERADRLGRRLREEREARERGQA
jgi:signal transduction histidine kinase